jgi:L-fuculose-phosphate aldolase
MDHPDLRQALCDTARRINAEGLNQGTSGNLSVRTDDGALLLTPSAVVYETMGPQDIVRMEMDGRWSCPAEGRRPTTEWRFHRDILAGREDAGSVVHVHSPCATALSCHRIGIPAFHYMIAIAGGNDIRCGRYQTFGTQALSEAALEALADRKACLLANHGLIAIGANLAKALAMAVEVETLAAQYWRARQLGEPVHLSADEMAEVHAKIKHYGSTADPVEADDDPSRTAGAAAAGHGGT